MRHMRIDAINETSQSAFVRQRGGIARPLSHQRARRIGHAQRNTVKWGPRRSSHETRGKVAVMPESDGNRCRAASSMAH